MKYVLMLGAMTAALSGCAGGTCDTGDTACKGGTTTGDAPYIEGIYYDCSGGSSCTWSVDASGGEMGAVDLYLAETGDTSGSCQTNPNCSDEGFWTEYHNNFSLAGTDGDVETKSITLTIVSSYEDQVQNSSTLFDMGNTTIENQLTYMAIVSDSAGNYGDCYGGGDDPSYFSGDCSNL